MKWARVENNIVREIIDFRPEGRFTDEIVNQFVECDDTVEQHSLFKEGKFYKPSLLLEPIDEKQIIELQLDELDKKSVRDAEDIYDVLIKKEIILSSDVPYIAERKEQKKVLREQLSNL